VHTAVNQPATLPVSLAAYDSAMQRQPPSPQDTSKAESCERDARRAHWEQVYASKAIAAVSWYQPSAAQSLALIRSVAPPPAATIIDVGGGASVLVDQLLDAGYRTPTVLDVAAGALAAAQLRLGERATQVHWLQSDILEAPLEPAAYDLWHDRAAFHFLTDPAQRARYRCQLLRSLRPGGHLVLACFATDGPSRCSGLPVVRYDAASLATELGEGFLPLQEASGDHVTPSGAIQRFLYMVFRHQPR